MSPWVTAKRWTYDNAQRYVTAFQPVSEAAHSWSYDSAICYALPVLWMTLYLRIKGHMCREHSVVMATELLQLPSVLLQWLTSLHHAQANAPAASYWLCTRWRCVPRLDESVMQGCKFACLYVGHHSMPVTSSTFLHDSLLIRLSHQTSRFAASSL